MSQLGAYYQSKWSLVTRRVQASRDTHPQCICLNIRCFCRNRHDSLDLDQKFLPEQRRDLRRHGVRATLFVERDSQKGIVIGRKGSVLKAVGTAVREQLPKGAYLELFVKVDKDWQRRAQALDRLGF